MITKNFFVLIVFTFLLSVTEAQTSCEVRRLMTTETEKYCGFAPKLKLQKDSLRRLLESKLSKVIFQNENVSTDTVQVFFEINSVGSVKTFTVFIEEKWEKNFYEHLQFFYKMPNMWCPGYFYNKLSRKKEIAKLSTWSIEIYLKKGKYDGVDIMD